MTEDKVLVAGGNGFIGSHMVDTLVDAGYRVRCLIRKSSRLDFIQKHVDAGTVKIVYGDVTDKASLDAAMVGIDIAYNFVAIAGKQNVPTEQYESVNFQGAKDMADIALKYGVKKFIYCSSTGVMGNIKQIPADENAPYNPKNDYERTKMKAEKYIQSLIDEHNFPAVIIRPAIVYGPRNVSNMSRMFQAIKNGGLKFFIIGSGENYWHMSYVKDITEGFLLAAEKPEAVGNTYILAGKKPITMNELTTTAASIMQVKAPKHLPYHLALFAGYCFLLPKKLLKMKVPIEPTGVRFLTNHRAYSIDKAVKDLGYNPQTNLQQGLSQTIKWYEENGIIK